MQLILLGPPGAGKGTQAVRLARRLGLAPIEPGRILREAAAGDSPTSREIRERLAACQLVDDQLVDRLVGERLERLSPGEGFILDGYPRTAGQARSLRETLARLGRLRRAQLVVWLRASPEILVRRRRERGRNQERPDDRERVIGHRLEIWRDHEQPLREALEGWADVIEIGADQPPDAITQEIVRALSRHAAAWISPRAGSLFRSDR